MHLQLGYGTHFASCISLRSSVLSCVSVAYFLESYWQTFLWAQLQFQCALAQTAKTHKLIKQFKRDWPALSANIQYAPNNRWKPSWNILFLSCVLFPVSGLDVITQHLPCSLSPSGHQHPQGELELELKDIFTLSLTSLSASTDLRMCSPAFSIYSSKTTFKELMMFCSQGWNANIVLTHSYL